nr:von Hippel-Lindau-like protein isoform X2 [Cherax quadricarinatus]
MMADGDPHNEALNAAAPPRPHPAIRSIHSRERSFVCFVNCTRRNVDVFWVDFRGKHIKYKTLARRERYKINTYVTHPWVFRDSETSSALVVNSEEAFYPKPALQPGQQVYGPASPPLHHSQHLHTSFTASRIEQHRLCGLVCTTLKLCSPWKFPKFLCLQ